MSMPSRFAKSADAKKAGWFSRRHKTNQAHRDEQDRQRRRREQKGLPKNMKDPDLIRWGQPKKGQ